MMFDAVPLSLGSLRAGKVRALAVTSSQRVDVISIQDVPTMAGSSIVGLEGGIWFGLVARPSHTCEMPRGLERRSHVSW
jgi:tripartite-type tricarboxylate transporter receptor subunit TctC